MKNYTLSRILKWGILIILLFLYVFSCLEEKKDWIDYGLEMQALTTELIQRDPAKFDLSKQDIEYVLAVVNKINADIIAIDNLFVGISPEITQLSKPSRYEGETKELVDSSKSKIEHYSKSIPLHWKSDWLNAVNGLKAVRSRTNDLYMKRWLSKQIKLIHKAKNSISRWFVKE